MEHVAVHLEWPRYYGVFSKESIRRDKLWAASNKGFSCVAMSALGILGASGLRYTAEGVALIAANLSSSRAFADWRLETWDVNRVISASLWPKRLWTRDFSDSISVAKTEFWWTWSLNWTLWCSMCSVNIRFWWICSSSFILLVRISWVRSCKLEAWLHPDWHKFSATSAKSWMRTQACLQTSWANCSNPWALTPSQRKPWDQLQHSLAGISYHDARGCYEPRSADHFLDSRGQLWRLGRQSRCTRCGNNRNTLAMFWWLWQTLDDLQNVASPRTLTTGCFARRELRGVLNDDYLLERCANWTSSESRCKDPSFSTQDWWSCWAKVISCWARWQAWE